MAQVLGLLPSPSGDWDEAPGSRLQAGFILTCEAIWGVNQQVEDLSLCLYYFYFK